MKKAILMIVVAVVIAGVSGGGVYLWQQGVVEKEKASLMNEISILQKQISQKQTVAPKETVNITNWKTYNTVENGWTKGLELALQYPSNLYSTMLAGGSLVSSWFADYSFDNLANINDAPSEYCKLSLDYRGSYDSSVPAPGLTVTLENKYNDANKGLTK